MRNTYLAVVCLALAVLIGAGFPSSVFSQEGIVVSPESPTETDSLEMTITAYCCMGMVFIPSTSADVSEGLIIITAERACGPFMMVTLYTHTVTVPPVEPGSYTVEYWVTGDCLISPNPILSTEIVVSPAPIKSDETAWGTIKALYR